MSRHRRSTEIAHRKAVERVIVAMRSRLEEPLSLEVLAEIALMSPYHFSRVFREVTGLPPRRFLGALRLEAAKQLLAATDLPIVTICFKVGYSSPGTFSNRFQRAVGLPPRDFRALTDPGVGNGRELLRVLRHQSASARPGKPAGGPGLRGQLLPVDESRGPIFIGLFPKAIPEGPPVACTVLDRPGDFLIPGVPEGSYHLFATTVPWSPDGRRHGSCDPAWVARHNGDKPLLIHRGREDGPVTLELAPPPLTAPPLLMSIRGFLQGAFARAQGPQGRRTFVPPAIGDRRFRPLRGR